MILETGVVSKPFHSNQHFASTIQKWNGLLDSEENFKKHCENINTYKKLENLGWIGVDLIYKFNSEGFRDDKFDQQPAGLALGCSHTQGTGIQSIDTWPKQLEKILDLKIWNLGVGAASLDTCYRLLDYWIENLNIKFVVCAVPNMYRYEIFVGRWMNVLVNNPLTIPNWLDGYQKNYVTYEQHSELNRRKNLLSMENTCNKHNVPFYYDLLEDFVDGSNARDLLHCGPSANHKLAKKFVNIINIQGNI
jgi:hypothetical protein